MRALATVGDVSIEGLLHGEDAATMRWRCACSLRSGRPRSAGRQHAA